MASSSIRPSLSPFRCSGGVSSSRFGVSLSPVHLHRHLGFSNLGSEKSVRYCLLGAGRSSNTSGIVPEEVLSPDYVIEKSGKCRLHLNRLPSWATAVALSIAIKPCEPPCTN
ncbi:hypothetical protein Gogos_011096 [Gossypium gossypioides]|uniref:Uncharacterized protein n=1 Tax=Gossypium gossypioides TaxID=34282 RepID=A0A7J9BN86_GOSGO|nr:hypothetical protein [Gossypium gossypioides]